MVFVNVGGQIFEEFVVHDIHDHHHDAEDVQDIGQLDLTNAEIDQLTITSGAQLKLDAAIAFTPADENGAQIAGAEYRLGRQEAIGDTTTGLLDGLNFKHTIDSEEQKVNIQLHQSQPTIKIEGTKEANVDWVNIEDSLTNQTVFAVHDDGTIESAGWASGSGNLPDGYHGSIAVQSESLYIGQSKLSEIDGKHVVKVLKSIPHIPVRLTQAPYSFTTGNINANTVRSINDWLVLARSVVSVSSGKALRIKDIFPAANDAADFEPGQLQGKELRAANDLLLKSTSGKVSIEGTSLDLAVGCQLTRNGTSIEGGSAPITELVYVDAGFSGTSDGSSTKPYATLSAAITARLGDDDTDTVCFHLAPGVYTGTISVDKTLKNQTFSITGSGMENTFIQGASSFSSSTGNVLYFRDFRAIELADVTVQFGKYGFYPRDCDKVTMRNVRFRWCGSAGTVNRHDQSGTIAEQAAYWAGNSTSDGGAIRYRTIGEVQIHSCKVEYCLRGLRLQDCGSAATASIVSNCSTFRTLESGLYCAASGYTQSSGCINLTISGCTVTESFNNSYLVIGGQDITIQGCTATRGANAGLQQWNSLDTRYIGNTLLDCNRRTYNGIGVLADAYAQIAINGNTDISGTGTYMAVLENNSFLKCNQGRADAIYGISIQERAGDGTYPVSSNKVFANNNVGDCPEVTFIRNPEPIPLTEGRRNGTVLGYLDATSSIQTQLDAKQGQLTFNSVASDNANPSTSAQIKSYVDTEVAGSGGSSSYFLGFGSTTSVTVTETEGTVWIYKSKNGGGSHQSHDRIIHLPASPADGFNIFLQAYDKVADPNDPPSQSKYISVQSPNDNEWKNHNAQTNEFSVHDISGDQRELRIFNCARKLYNIWFKDDDWYCEIVGGLTFDQHTLLQHSDRWFHFESGASTTYNLQAVREHYTFQTGVASGETADILQLPDGYKNYLVRYGFGSETWQSSGYGPTGLGGTCIRLPINPVDGTVVECHSGKHTTSNASEGKECINVIFDVVGGETSSRRINWCPLTQGDWDSDADEDDPENEITIAANLTHSPFVCASSNTHGRIWRIVYCETPDIWLANQIGQ